MLLVLFFFLRRRLHPTFALFTSVLPSAPLPFAAPHLPPAATTARSQPAVGAHPQLPVLARRQRPDQRLIQPFGHTVAACPATPQTHHALGLAADPQISFAILAA